MFKHGIVLWEKQKGVKRLLSTQKYCKRSCSFLSVGNSISCWSWRTVLTLHGVTLKEKWELKNVMLSLIKDLKAMYGFNVKYARCDNAGENEDIEGLVHRKGWVLNLNTPLKLHYNQTVVLGSNLLLHSTRHMQSSIVGNFLLFKKQICAEGVNTVTPVENNLCTPMRNLIPFQLF